MPPHIVLYPFSTFLIKPWKRFLPTDSKITYKTHINLASINHRTHTSTTYMLTQWTTESASLGSFSTCSLHAFDKVGYERFL